MYNPSEVGKKGTIFGLPYDADESDLILLPVHFDVTTSYVDGTAQAPNLILEESSQLDLSQLAIHEPWNMKMAMIQGIGSLSENDRVRDLAKGVIDALENGNSPNKESLNQVNAYCEQVHNEIENRCSDLLDQHKLIGIVGGDHSSPLGLIRAIAKRDQFGILQIDAHMDLRNAYEGFTFSHASIMYNVLKEDSISSLTQVGIRDFCEEEENYIANSIKQIDVFYDEVLFRNKMDGVSWSDQVKAMVDTLPDNVYISFDVDGLDPSLCPNTGTPVPGGLRFNEVIYLVEQVVRSGRKIVGFDLCETGNHAWDANVSARVLFRLAIAMGVSQKLLSFK
ncbi:MAG: agmatinase family protein [Ekhidna sp.]